MKEIKLTKQLNSADELVEGKICTKCKSFTELGGFYKQKGMKSGLSSWCKACKIKYTKPYPGRKEYCKNWAKSPIGKLSKKKYRLKRYFNLTIEQYNEMRKNQNYCCGTCGKSELEAGRALDLDHNHTTGKVRGLLCNLCNQTIGLVKENIDILNKIIDYLKLHNPHKVSNEKIPRTY
jgi:hypothetical protein